MMNLKFAISGVLVALLVAFGLASYWAYSLGKSGRHAFYIRNLWTVANHISVKRNQMVAMRDGVRLATDIYLPRRFAPPYPLVFVQTPYDKVDYFGGLHALTLFANHGYAIAVQDVRGRYASEGEFSVYSHAVEDGWDSMTWLADQDWSNGAIGTFGCSALGEIQYLQATAMHPNHRAMIVEAGGGAIGAAQGRHGYFGLYEGGVFNLAAGAGWFSQSGSKTRFEVAGKMSLDLLRHLPIVEIVRKSGAPPTDYEDFVSHPPGSAWWSTQPFLASADGFAVPGLHVNSWFDLGTEDSITLASGTADRNRAEQRTIISPATHCESESIQEIDRVGELPVVGGDLPYGEIYREWFGRWLKNESSPDLPPYRIFVLNKNRWVDLSEWPPAGVTFENWYLSDVGSDRTSARHGRLDTGPPVSGVFTYRYDPLDPVLTRGGPHCCTGNPLDQPGSFDQSLSASRADVLLFDSEIMSNPLTVAGPLRVMLHVSTSAADTDFTAKLIDVWPDGRAFNIQDGVFRLRYRNGYERPEMAEEGKVYAIEISLRAIAYEFPAGHRLRLEVSSSNFPRLARNLNTGGDVHAESLAVPAENSVHVGAEVPSRLILPVWTKPPGGGN